MRDLCEPGTYVETDHAFTHTRTASITLGTPPPRELRSVATLFTFTDSFAISP